MADVYRAEVTGAAGFSRTVAIKRLHNTFSADRTFCDMFVREAQVLSQLHHANIVSVLDFECDQKGQLFLVMELVDGVNLAQLAGKGRLPIPVAVHVMAAVLRALVYAHARNIIHRDISPHNVLISWMGEVKLSDFGLAKATNSSHVSPVGLVKGKVRYLSPDQVQGLELDGRADLFSVGVMFYEMVTGRPPFAREGPVQPTMAESIALMLTAAIVPPRALQPDVPVALEGTIMRLLEREREQRFASAQEALDTLGNPGHETDALIALLAERFPESERHTAGEDEDSESSGEFQGSLHMRIGDMDRGETGDALRAGSEGVEIVRATALRRRRRRRLVVGLASLASLLVLVSLYSRHEANELAPPRASVSRPVAPALISVPSASSPPSPGNPTPALQSQAIPSPGAGDAPGDVSGRSAHHTHHAERIVDAGVVGRAPVVTHAATTVIATDIAAGSAPHPSRTHTDVQPSASRALPLPDRTPARQSIPPAPPPDAAPPDAAPADASPVVSAPGAPGIDDSLPADAGNLQVKPEKVKDWLELDLEQRSDSKPGARRKR